MQSSTMNFNGLVRQNSQDSYILEGSLRKKGRLWYRRSLKGNSDKHQENGSNSTVPRGWKQASRTRSSSLVDYSDPQRITLELEKQDNETFGFEIQTYGLQQKNSTLLEMCTFVCRVQEDSAAESAGLTTGDVIVTINGVSIEGSTHQHIVDLIHKSTNLLKMETVCGSVVKRIELEKKMNLLKQTLREKWVELQTLTLQEKRLTRGNLNDSSLHPSMDSLVSLVSPTGRSSQRFSSDSSCQSVMTEDSVFGDLSSPSPYSAASVTDDSCFFSSRDFLQDGPSRRPSCPSLSSNLAGSSSSLSPSWDSTRAASLFGTLPRKGRRGSVRKHILKFLPGLHRSVEEEEDHH